MNTRSLSMSAFALGVLVSGAHGTPSLFSYASMGATNLDLTNYINNLEIDYSSTGAPTAASIDRSWSGLNGPGTSTETMRFEATSSASSTYGRLRTRVEGKVSNTYYNPSNTPYYTEGPDEDGDGRPDEFFVNDEGSPDSFSAVGTAGFTDDLAFRGIAGMGYTAQYVFFIHGAMSGDDFVFPTLSAKIGTKGEDSITIDRTPSGQVAQYFATKEYAIDPLIDETVDVYFTTQFNPSVYFFPDGSTIEGAGLFDATVTFMGVRVFDPSGAQVTNLTITGSSGTSYSANPVPEPASFAALGLGALAVLRCRRKA